MRGESEIDRRDRIAERLEKAILRSLKDERQFNRYIVTEKRGSDTQTEEYIFGRADYKAMGELVKVVQAIEEIRGGGEGDAEPAGVVILPQAEEKSGG